MPEEDLVKCPVDGCDEEFVKRGLFMHIWSTDDSPGKGHRPRESIPPDLNLEEVDITGKTTIKNSYPDTVELDNAEYFDTYTGKTYQGKRGLMVHLGQLAGENNIPEDVTERFEADDFPVVETDENGNITEVLKWGSDKVPPVEPYLPWFDNTDSGYIHRKKVREIVQEAKKKGSKIDPEQIEQELLT